MTSMYKQIQTFSPMPVPSHGGESIRTNINELRRRRNTWAELSKSILWCQMALCSAELVPFEAAIEQSFVQAKLLNMLAAREVLRQEYHGGIDEKA
jgi:hypothetical protein